MMVWLARYPFETGAGSFILTAKIRRLARGPGRAPELAAAIDGERFGGDEFSGGAGEIDGCLRDIPRRARAHHRVRARIGGAGFFRVDVPTLGLDRAGRHAIDADIQWRPFDRNRARKPDDAGPRGD